MAEFKQYTIDTNVIRYDTDASVDPALRRASRRFWRMIKEDIEHGEATILVPAEVVRELKVQSHTLSSKENIRIKRVLEKCIEVSPAFSIELEHIIREMSAYLRAHFRNELKHLPMSYGGVSDARILYSAYNEDSILVTANIKDFLLYPFLFAQSETRLYDLKQNKFIQISQDAHSKVWQDETFKKMFQQLSDLEQSLED